MNTDKRKTFKYLAIILAAAATVAVGLGLIYKIVRQDRYNAASGAPPLDPRDTGRISDEPFASVSIDAGRVRYPVIKGNFGGKIMKESRYSSIMQSLAALKKLAPGFWIYTIDSGPDSRYRWDTHRPLPGGSEEKGVQFSVLGNVMAVNKSGKGKIAIDYWDSTDLRHSVYVEKYAGEKDTSLLYLMRDKAGKSIARSDIHYARFDVRIDSDKPFVSPDGDEWELARARSKTWSNLYHIWITRERRLRVRFFSDDGKFDLPLSAALSIGKWHTIEIRYDVNSSDATAVCCLNGRQVGRKDHIKTTGKKNNIGRFRFGAVSGTGASGKIHIDALRFSDSEIGREPGLLKNYPGGTDFDNNAMTIDDFLHAAEEAGFTPVMQAPMYPPGDRIKRDEYSSAQWNADLVEYVNGQADPDYTEKAARLDFTHETPEDNWANLRAARGRTRPYGVKHWLMGSEPYWAEGWPKDGKAYARACLKHIEHMKATDPDILCAVHLCGSRDWDKAVLIINHEALDFICVRHDYAREGGRDLSKQIGRLLGIPCAVSIKTGKPWIIQHTNTRKLINRYLADRADRKDIPTVMDEHGYMIVYPPGRGDSLAYGLFRIAYRMETIERCGPTAWDGDWLVHTDYGYRYGVVGSGELTPSYWAYRLFNEHFRDEYLGIVVDSTRYIIRDKNNNSNYTAPHISCYASRSGEDGSLSIIIINRHMNKAASVEINLKNFEPESDRATVHTLGGNGVKPLDDNETDPNNIVPRRSEISVSQTGFKFSAEAVSMSVIVIERRKR